METAVWSGVEVIVPAIVVSLQCRLPLPFRPTLHALPKCCVGLILRRAKVRVIVIHYNCSWSQQKYFVRFLYE